MDWENHSEKNPIQRSQKLKIKVKLPHVNKKPLARKRIFAQTSFSHSTSKLERKNFTPQNHSLFRSTSCFGVTKITTPIWLQKSWKCVKIFKKKTAPQYKSNFLKFKKPKRRTIIAPAIAVRLLKKRQRPNTIKILWIVKNQEKTNNSPSYRWAAINKYSSSSRNKIGPL